MLIFLSAFYLIPKRIDDDKSHERDNSTMNSAFIVDF